MRKIISCLTVVFWLCVLVFLPCFSSRYPSYDIEKDPEFFNIGYWSGIFSSLPRQDAKVASDFLMKLVLENSPRPVKTKIYYDYEDFLRDINNATVDMQVFTATDYIRYRDRIDVEPFLVTVSGGEVLQEYILLVHEESGVDSVEQLAKKRFLIETGNKGDIGRIWLDTLLMEKDLSYSNKYFATVKAVDKSSEAVIPVFFKQADACVVTRNSYETLVELNPQLGRKLKVVEISPPLLTLIFCYQNYLNREQKDIIRECAVEVGNTVEGQQIFLIYRIDNLKFFDPEYLKNVEDLVRRHDSLRGKF